MSLRLLMIVPMLVLAGCKAIEPKAEAPVAPFAHSADSKVDEIKDLSVIDAALSAASGKRVLLVLDIDDTLLTSEPFFGSDSWYEWQDKLPDGHRAKVPCRFDIIALNYEAGTQKVTQDNGPDIVSAVTVDRLMLTSRGANYRAGTMRELAKAKYPVLPMIGTPAHGESWRWSDVTRPDKRTYSLSYADGVFMTTGANKGNVLLHLLERRGLKYDHVILADDGRHNIVNMQKALAGAGVSYHGLWYTHVDKTVDRKDIRDGKRGWKAWEKLMRAVYPTRLDRMNAKECFN